MNIIDALRNAIRKFLRLDKLPENPNDERFTYINDPGDLHTQAISEARVWYLGDSNELLNYYTNEQVYGNYDNGIYNRNRANYFWGISSQEASIKRIHSGIPRAIVDTLTNAVGYPQVTVTFNGKEQKLENFFQRVALKKKTMQEQLPLTMAIGYGAWKVSVDPKCKYPVVQFYEAKDVEFITRNGEIIGLIFKDYYRYNGKNYLLLDTRHLDDKGNSMIEYELFRLDANNEVTHVEMETIPELAELKDITFYGYPHVLGVPCRFFHDMSNPIYGRSIYDGKYDLFDDLDQSLSQRSQTSRVSTPVEYFPADVLERDAKGNPRMPKVYNRQYVQKEGMPDGDGRTDGTIQTTQPQLNFEQYSMEQKAILDMILTGVLSPATMGIDIAKKDNADAQREKEKVTIMTRNSIIADETEILKELVTVTVGMMNYIETGRIPLDGLEVSVKFSEFANPSFESLSQTLLPLWQAGAMSDEMFVSKLYGDSLSQDEKNHEIEALKKAKQADNMGLGAFENDDREETMGAGMGAEEANPEEPKSGGGRVSDDRLQGSMPR